MIASQDVARGKLNPLVYAFGLLALMVLLTMQTPPVAAWPIGHDTTIDTTSAWDEVNGVGQFGEPNIATFGQTFSANRDLILNDFSFWLRDSVASPGESQFVAYVMLWNGNVTGPMLYQSDPFTVSSTTFKEFKFHTGGVNLSSSTEYIAFLSASTLFDGVEDSIAAGFTGTDVCSTGFGGIEQGCGFVFNANGADFDRLYSSGWALDKNDLAFKATFSDSTPVPEPATILLLASGLAGMGGMAWWNRHT